MPFEHKGARACVEEVDVKLPFPPGAAHLWVDVSALLRCQGAFTGIPRTIASLVLAWMERGDVRLRFCSFSRTGGHYREVPREKLLGLLLTRRAAASVGGAAVHSRRPPLASARAVLWRVARSLPHGWKTALRAAARQATIAGSDLGWFFLGTGIQALRRGSRLFHPQGGVWPAPAPFATGDAVLIPGGWWDDAASFPILREYKQKTGLRVAYVIYDLIAYRLPQLLSPALPGAFMRHVPDVLDLADTIGTISENSRRDLLALAADLGKPAPPMRVLRLGDDAVRGQESVCPRGLPAGWETKPFVLTVGTVESRKNHRLLYQVWRQLIEQFGPTVPPLVIAGGFGWLTGDLRHEIETDPLTREHLHFLPQLADAELDWLYEHCLFTLYPSHYEGWGLPVAEGLARGKYCIASSASALPEVGGDLIDYHDPLDFVECFQLVKRALFEDGFVQRREERLRREYRVHSWSECAASYVEMLERDLDRLFREGTPGRPSDDLPEPEWQGYEPAGTASRTPVGAENDLCVPTPK
jgi:glycosyltransferase involved in cell wall biosynthesis